MPDAFHLSFVTAPPVRPPAARDAVRNLLRVTARSWGLPPTTLPAPGAPRTRRAPRAALPA